MLDRIRRRLTFANVVSVIALFVALGGSSYAALRIDGSQIENRSVSGKKLKRNTVGGATVRESRLGKVPRAKRADRLGRYSAGQLKLRCPGATVMVSGACLELRGARGPVAYGLARIECSVANRRLPTYEELANLVSASEYGLGAGGELTSNVFRAGGGALQVVVVKSEEGGVEVVPSTAGGARRFRCVALPSN